MSNLFSSNFHHQDSLIRKLYTKGYTTSCNFPTKDLFFEPSFTFPSSCIALNVQPSSLAFKILVIAGRFFKPSPLNPLYNLSLLCTLM